MKNTLEKPLILGNHTKQQLSNQLPDALLIQIASFSISSTKNNTAYCKVYLSENYKTLKCILIIEQKTNSFTKTCNAWYKERTTQRECSEK